MNERIKQLRSILNLTQDEFGKKLGVTRSAISYLESGRSNVTEQMLFMICVTFDVRKEWVKFGTGEIFSKSTVEEELATYMGRLMNEENQEKEKFALIALKLIVDEWELIQQNVKKFNDILSWIQEKPIESEMP